MWTVDEYESKVLIPIVAGNEPGAQRLLLTQAIIFAIYA